MKTFKIYGEKYVLKEHTKEPCITYAFRNQLTDDKPKGKVVGYVVMDDGSVVECYKKFNPLVIIIPLLLIFLGAGGFFAYLFFMQPKDIEILGNRIQLQEDNLVVTYNGFPSVRSNEISVQFQNGSYPAKIKVEGEGIETTVINVEPDAYVDTIPCKFTTTNGVVEAKFTIVTETSEQSFPIVVEIPDNLNPNETESGLEGFWKGETIYGAH